MRIIEEPKQNSIPVSEMKDGDIAEIVDWSADRYIGQIIKRIESVLFSLSHDSYWLLLPSGEYNRVRILPKGTKLEI